MLNDLIDHHPGLLIIAYLTIGTLLTLTRERFGHELATLLTLLFPVHAVIVPALQALWRYLSAEGYRRLGRLIGALILLYCFLRMAGGG